MRLVDIHFHDSRLLKVTEIPELDSLLFEVNYPVDWKNNVFERRVIAFRDVLAYRVDEGPFSGTPTFLDVYEHDNVGSRQRIEIQTNAGTRSLLFASVELLKPEEAY